MKHREFAFAKLRTRGYKHVSTKNNFNRNSGQLSYLYIGSNFEYLSKMITGFDTSYYSPDFASALKFLSQSYSGCLPDVVLFDGTYDKQQINCFLETLHMEYGNDILAIAEASGCSSKQLNFIRHSKLIDDIISLDIAGDALKCKVKFLQTTKSIHHPKLLRKKLETCIDSKNVLHCYSKRLFEIVMSAILLILLLPLLLIIALAIRLESKGPIFYAAPRAGRGYRIFKFYKFRTMVANADKKVKELSHLNQYAGGDTGAVFFKAANDPRITKVGAFLRNTSLDELLQLFNILLGDMSFVGNRPLPLYEAAVLTTDEYAARFMAPAGITGLWQIKKRGSANMSVQERISLDIDYAEKNNFVYDMWIIANTPTALLQKANV